MFTDTLILCIINSQPQFTIMQVEVFYFEGCYFLGNFEAAVKRYEKARPGKKLFIWICDTFTELKPIK